MTASSQAQRRKGMTPGAFKLEVHIGGFLLTCVGCGRDVYMSENGEYGDYDAEHILRGAIKHRCAAQRRGGRRAG